jgi:hypothetical protein
MKATADG